MEITATVYPEGAKTNLSFNLAGGEYAEIVEAPEENKTEYYAGYASTAVCHVRMLHGSSGGNTISLVAHDETMSSYHIYSCVIFDELPPE